jgi:hypothetical protein
MSLTDIAWCNRQCPRMTINSGGKHHDDEHKQRQAWCETRDDSGHFTTPSHCQVCPHLQAMCASVLIKEPTCLIWWCASAACFAVPCHPACGTSAPIDHLMALVSETRVRRWCREMSRRSFYLWLSCLAGSANQIALTPFLTWTP